MFCHPDMLPFACVALLCWCALIAVVSPLITDFEMQSITNMNGSSSVPIDFDLSTKRIKKGLFGISGTIRITDDPAPYSAEVLIHHSAARNNVYKLAPFKVPLGKLCDKIKGEYRQYLMNDLHPVSDLPFSEDKNEDLCPKFEKGKTFEIKNFQFNKDNIPKFLQSGQYKIQIILRKDGDIVSGCEAIADLV